MIEFRICGDFRRTKCGFEQIGTVDSREYRRGTNGSRVHRMDYFADRIGVSCVGCVDVWTVEHDGVWTWYGRFPTDLEDAGHGLGQDTRIDAEPRRPGAPAAQ